VYDLSAVLLASRHGFGGGPVPDLYQNSRVEPVTFAAYPRSPAWAKEIAMRWWIIALPFCMGATPDPGAMLPIEIGVLSCTLGHAIDPQMSDQTGSASEARDMLCVFTPARDGPDEAYAGALRSINAGKTLPENVALLWKVRAPVGTRASPGLLEQSYAADPASSPGHAAPLVGERNSHITLHTMSEKQEGAASKEQRPTPRFVLTTIELKLKGATS
jgi:hypothetical protein